VNESEFYDLLRGAGDAAFVVDQKGTILFWSSAAKQLLGFSAAEMENKDCATVLDGCDSAGARVCKYDCAALDSSRHNQRLPAFDVHVRTATGARRWFSMSIVTARVQGKSVLVHLVRDIDMQKRAVFLVKEIATLADRLAGQKDDPVVPADRAHAPVVELSPQETRILRALSQGMNTGGIARELNVSAVTVRNHVQHILRKLNAHTRLEAVLRAGNLGLL
jgi:PAS domain S-box-containing protein